MSSFQRLWVYTKGDNRSFTQGCKEAGNLEEESKGQAQEDN